MSAAEWDILIGPFLSRSSLAKVFGVSEMEISTLQLYGFLLDTTTPDNVCLFPAFQFESGDYAALMPCMVQILAILRTAKMDKWSIALWLNTPSLEFDGLTPTQALHSDYFSDDGYLVLTLAEETARSRISH